MSERKYTDAEVLKALYCCNAGVCEECPVGKEVCYDLPLEVIAAALINRQKAEIEEWKSNANDWQNQYLKLIEEMEIYQEHIDQDIIYAKAIKTEAIKDFAERLKANMCHGYPYLEIEEDLFRRDVDNLVAEMTEGE